MGFIVTGFSVVYNENTFFIHVFGTLLVKRLQLSLF